LLNSRGKWIGEKFKYGWASKISLGATLAFFLWATAMNVTF